MVAEKHGMELARRRQLVTKLTQAIQNGREAILIDDGRRTYLVTSQSMFSKLSGVSRRWEIHAHGGSAQDLYRIGRLDRWWREQVQKAGLPAASPPSPTNWRAQLNPPWIGDSPTWTPPRARARRVKPKNEPGAIPTPPGSQRKTGGAIGRPSSGGFGPLPELATRSELFAALTEVVTEGREAILIDDGRRTYLVTSESMHWRLSRVTRRWTPRAWAGSAQTLYYVGILDRLWRRQVQAAGLPIVSVPETVPGNWQAWLSPPWFYNPRCPTLWCDPRLQRPPPRSRRLPGAASDEEALAQDSMKRPTRSTSKWNPPLGQLIEVTDPKLGLPNLTFSHEADYPLIHGVTFTVSVRLEVVPTEGATRQFLQRDLPVFQDKLPQFAKSFNQRVGRRLLRLPIAEDIVIHGLRFIVDVGNFEGLPIQGFTVVRFRFQGRVKALEHNGFFKVLGGMALDLKVAAAARLLTEINKMAEIANALERKEFVPKRFKHPELRRAAVEEADKAIRLAKEALEEVEEDLGKKVARKVSTRAARVLIKLVPILNALSLTLDVIDVMAVIKRALTASADVASNLSFHRRFDTLVQSLARNDCYRCFVGPLNGEGHKCRIAGNLYENPQPIHSDNMTGPWPGFAIHKESKRLVWVEVVDGKEVLRDYQGWLMVAHGGETPR